MGVAGAGGDGRGCVVDGAQVLIRRGEWSPQISAWLEKAIRHDPTMTVRTLEALCDNGDAALYEVVSGDVVVAAGVFRVDVQELGDDLVIVAAGGKLPGYSLIRSLLPHLEKIFTTCRWVRVHTARRGMIKELSKLGYKGREVVMAKEINHGR